MLALLSQHDLDRHGLVTAADLDADLVARLLLPEERANVIEAGDLLAVHLEEYVVGLQAGFFRRRAGHDLGNLAFLAVGIGLDAEVGSVGAAAPDLARRQPIEGLAVGVHRHVDVGGDRVADAAMDADDLAGHVEEWAARVAADQRAIGGDGRLRGIEDASQPNHRRPPGLEAAGMTDGDAPLPLLQVFRLAHVEEGPVTFVGDLDKAAVDAVIGAEGLALQASAIGEDDDGLPVGLRGHMAGGEDITVLADDDAAARALADADTDGAGQ